MDGRPDERGQLRARRVAICCTVAAKSAEWCGQTSEGPGSTPSVGCSGECQPRRGLARCSLLFPVVGRLQLRRLGACSDLLARTIALPGRVELRDERRPAVIVRCPEPINWTSNYGGACAAAALIVWPDERIIGVDAQDVERRFELLRQVIVDDD